MLSIKFDSKRKYHQPHQPLSKFIDEDNKTIKENVHHIQQFLSLNYLNSNDLKLKTVPSQMKNICTEKKKKRLNPVSFEGDCLTDSQQMKKLLKCANALHQDKQLKKSIQEHNEQRKKHLCNLEFESFLEEEKKRRKAQISHKQIGFSSPKEIQTHWRDSSVVTKSKKRKIVSKFLRINRPLLKEENRYCQLKKQIDQLEHQAKTRYGICFTKVNLYEDNQLHLNDRENVEMKFVQEKLNEIRTNTVEQEDKDDCSIPLRLMSLVRKKNNFYSQKKGVRRYNGHNYIRI